jgi:hypothetical protein
VKTTALLENTEAKRRKKERKKGKGTLFWGSRTNRFSTTFSPKANLITRIYPTVV